MLAVEKTGAANVLITEKTTSELRVQAERLHAADAAKLDRFQIDNNRALSDIRLEQQKQACELERKIAECCCEIQEKIAALGARVEAIDAQRVRDDLAQCRAELLALRK